MNNKTILITGASGLVGTAVTKHLLGLEWRVLGLSRTKRESLPDGIEWLHAPAGCEAEAFAETNRDALSSCTHVLNLAGSSIGEGRFTEKRKEEILSSRVQITRLTGEALRYVDAPLHHWIQASGIGFYGNSGDQPATESGRAGDLYLSGVCVEWEQEARTQVRAFENVPLSILRLGVVLAAHAPAWKKMLLPFHLGAGGPLGSGKQWFSWVMLEDVIQMVTHLLGNPETADGIWNGTAPGTVMQRDMAKEIGKAYRRPSVVPTPAWALRLALGEMADELVLASCNAKPERFEQAGFSFLYPELPSALARLSASG